MFILTCVFNGLAGGGPNGKRGALIEDDCTAHLLSGIFNKRTGSISDGNKTEFTPAGKEIFFIAMNDDLE